MAATIRAITRRDEGAGGDPSKRNRKLFIPHEVEVSRHRNRIERCYDWLQAPAFLARLHAAGVGSDRAAANMAAKPTITLHGRDA